MGKVRAGLRVLAPLAASVMLMAAGCGSGGGATATPPPPPPPPPPTGGAGPTWTPGVFASASQFKDQCKVVRTGVDIEGNPFPDKSGSTLLENFWLRSWTNETYLWNDEVVDRNPADFNDRLAYFALLKTNAITASGKPKDQFHFSQSTEDFLEAINSAPIATYGATFFAFSATVPRDIRVQYTEPDSPAAEVVSGQPNLIRGTRILEIDGIDLVNANTLLEVDMLNKALFPPVAGEVHTFEVRDPGSETTRTITMMSTDLAFKPVNRTAVIDTPSGQTGYILLNTFSPFSSEKDIAEAITAMKSAGVSDLVVDLRYNGGGLLAVASELGYMIAGAAQSNSKAFERLRFNADAGGINPITGGANQPLPFLNTGQGFSLPSGTPLDTLNLSRVFILSTAETCSASEAVINGLRGIDVEVNLIGDTTCGKPFGFFPQDNCGETYFTIQFQGVNDKGFGDFADGFAPANSSAAVAVKIPGCAVADDLSHELGDENEAVLAAALQFRQTGACPAPPTSQAPSTGITTSAAGADAIAIDMTPRPEVMKHNLDMRMPNDKQ